MKPQSAQARLRGHSPYIRYSARNVSSNLCERSERVPIAREQLSVAMLDYGGRAIAVELQLEDPLKDHRMERPAAQRARWAKVRKQKS
jgi:hypothetical protein